MTAHFNIALYPQSDSLTRYLVELAQINLSGKSDKYLLGDVAYPHITLCQFICAPELINEVWDVCAKLYAGPVSIYFSHMYIKAGSAPLHQGKNWIGLSVAPTADLSDLQKSVFKGLKKLDIESPTDPLKYFPHLTLGRLDQASAVTISPVPDCSFWQTTYQFDISLGRSDEYGVYLERLY
jgi:2'-5' RNA ligase